MLMAGNDYITSQILMSQPWLLKLAYKLTLNLDDAKDLLQETILKILDNKNRFNQGTNFRNWSSVIMKNIFINHRRRLAKIRPPKEEKMWNAIPDSMCNKASEVSPESNLSKKEILNTINCCSQNDSQPFKLFLAGYSYKEIAEKLSLPIGTVKSRIYITRRNLQSILAGDK